MFVIRSRSIVHLIHAGMYMYMYVVGCKNINIEKRIFLRECIHVHVDNVHIINASYQTNDLFKFLLLFMQCTVC